MSRNVVRNGVLALLVSSMGVLAVFAVWKSAPDEAVRAADSTRSWDRDELQRELERREREIESLRMQIAMLEEQLASARQSREPAESTVEPPAKEVEQPRSQPSGLDAAVALLRNALPERFGKLTADEAGALTELDLRGAAVADADLALLAALPSLQTLCLRGTAVTDAGLASLRGIAKLTTLDLRGTKVTGAGVRELPAFQLTALHLTDTQVTGDELRWWPSMPNLETLKLNQLKFGDDAVGDLALFPAVQHLELDGTSISDAGLSRLLDQNHALRRIELRRTSITPAAVAELRGKYPGIDLVTDFTEGGVLVRR